MKKVNKASALLAGAMAVVAMGCATCNAHAVPAEKPPVTVKAIAENEARPTPVSAELEQTITALYGVPLEADLQAKIIHICEEYCIDPAIIFAMMSVESDYRTSAVGDNGAAEGLLQVQRRWHGERIARLGVTDLKDPIQNVTVAADYLAELTDYYDGNVIKAITAYNAGPSGAYKGWFSRGINQSDYCVRVLTIAQKLAEGVVSHELY